MTLSIVCYDTLYHDKSIAAIEKSLETLGDRVSSVYWFSDRHIEKDLGTQVIWVPIPPIQNATLKGFMRATNDLCFRLIPQFVDADHALYVQYDGFAVNPEAWTDEFLEYDYIGAIWADNNRVGNGGFSLRSRKLHEALAKMYVPEYFMNNYAEDSLICRMFGRALTKEVGIRFAGNAIAAQFSIEHTPPEKYRHWIGKSLGFHERWHCADYGYNPDTLKGARPYE